MKKLYPYPKNKRLFYFYFLQFVLVFGFIFSANGQKVHNDAQKSSTANNTIKPVESTSLILKHQLLPPTSTSGKENSLAK